ncbi:MAG: NAD(P)-dependent oxidoreductase [Vicinamibacterales bacterium]
MVTNPLAEDLDHILGCTEGLWSELRGERVFITGGTGFFGCWLLESFAWANDRLGLGASALVLTRDPGAFASRVPHLARHPAVQFHVGDVRSFEFPNGKFSHVLHGATDASAKLLAEDPRLMFDTIVEGTRRVLEFARHCRARTLLLASSGAVYGRQPAHVAALGEDDYAGPDPTIPASAYGEGKRAAELLCVLESARSGFEAKIARGFAFVGPYLPLDRHFAIGNFIRDAMAGGPVVVKGDGTSVRSYLYGADLVVWLLTILVKGAAGRAYNVGSDRAISVRELAESVTRLLGVAAPVILGEPATARPAGPDRYVPCTRRAERELGLRATIDLDAGIVRTKQWYEQQPQA